MGAESDLPPHSNGDRVVSNGVEPYSVTELPLGTPRQLRVITIGAGAAGLNMARHIEIHMENVDHLIYEKNPEVGGTWFENKCVLPQRERCNH
jgi:hypothetical protein